jgi:DNA-binding NarL/FixJ family response regulator
LVCSTLDRVTYWISTSADQNKVRAMRILIAEDQKQTRKSLRLLLKTLPSIEDIREAADGVEAVRLIPELQPNLVVMDGRMPKMDGVEATRIIKAKWPHMKVILLSMYPEYREAASQAGADAFVSKGEPPEKLLDTICAILD